MSDVISVKKAIAATLLAGVLCLAAPARAAETLLVRDGKPAATIVLAEDASEGEALAAEELVSHIEKMSGAKLGIHRGAKELDIKGTIIWIGRAEPNPGLDKVRAGGDDPAAFRLRVSDGNVMLAGLSDAGTLNAAYELLEQLGVRWLIPGDLGVVIPEKKTVAAAHQDTIQRPGFCGRRLQALCSRPASKQQVASIVTWQRRMRLGGFDSGGHGLGIRADRKEEPELFMEENGRATNKFRISHPEVQRRVIAHWREVLKKNPDLDYMRIGPTDGCGFGSDAWDADDYDPMHGQVSVTDRYVKFFNLVLEDIQKDYPNVGLSFYCYSLHMRPPVREKPNPKILPVFAPINVCRLHAVDNPLCWERQYIKDLVEGWKALGVKMMYRGYLFNLADPGLPFSMIRQVAAEYPYYHREGVIACRVECKPDWGYHGPTLYLATKIMWNPDLDVEALLEDYFSKLYGPAAAPMRAHFDRIEDAYEQADFHTGNTFDIPHVLTPEVMAQLEKTLKQAEGLAPAGSVYARRIDITRQGFEFGKASLAMMAALNSFEFVEAKSKLDLVLNEILPKATALDPPAMNSRFAPGYTKRFWSGTVTSAAERVTNGNEIVAKLPDEWLFMLDPLDGGEGIGLWKPTAGTGSWQPLKTYSQSWSNQGLRYYKGEVWYRTTAGVAAKFKGRKIRLWMGGVDDTPKAWINGKALDVLAKGAAPTGRPWEFEATDAVKFGEPNVIIVKVSNRAINELGTGGITGPAMLWAEAK